VFFNALFLGCLLLLTGDIALLVGLGTDWKYRRFWLDYWGLSRNLGWYFDGLRAKTPFETWVGRNWEKVIIEKSFID
jgi:hypothetical protein